MKFLNLIKNFKSQEYAQKRNSQLTKHQKQHMKGCNNKKKKFKTKKNKNTAPINN